MSRVRLESIASGPHDIPECPRDPDNVEGDVSRLRRDAEACKEMLKGKSAMQQILAE
jgi:hypothetical protein